MTNQAPQVSLNFAFEDSMLVLSYEFVNIRFCELLVISEIISDYGAQAFSLHNPRDCLPFYLITCSFPHRTSKDGDILHLPRHLILKLGSDFTLHGFILWDEIYQLLGCSSHGSNSQALLISRHLI